MLDSKVGYGFENSPRPKARPEGLEPHLDAWLKSNERAKARRVRQRATDPDRFWQVCALVVLAVVLLVGGVL